MQPQGCRAPAVYYHFKAKEEIVLAVLEPAFVRMRAFVSSAEAALSPAESAEIAMRGLVDLTIDERQVVATLFRDPDVSGSCSPTTTCGSSSTAWARCCWVRTRMPDAGSQCPFSAPDWRTPAWTLSWQTSTTSFCGTSSSTSAGPFSSPPRLRWPPETRRDWTTPGAVRHPGVVLSLSRRRALHQGPSRRALASRCYRKIMTSTVKVAGPTTGRNHDGCHRPHGRGHEQARP